MDASPKHAFLVIFLVVSCAPSWAVTQKSLCLKDHVTSELVEDFRNLRLVKGHFDGGMWNDDVDAWMGRKHRIMIALASQLSDGRCDEDDLIQILGPTDQVARRGETLFKQVVPSNSLPETVNKVLVYHWRGSHDVLFFVPEDNKIVRHHWWHAGEE